MPRTGRKAPGGIIYHTLNRGNGRAEIFHKEQDYDAFLRLLAEVLRAVPVRLLCYCLMPNHWHLVLWPAEDGQLSNFMLRLGIAHARRYHAHYHNEAGGHLYQGRFKSFPVQDDAYYLTLCRYVEANALRAGLVARAQDWRWSSLAARAMAAPPVPLEEWPVLRPADWERIVNEAVGEADLAAIRESLRRGRPFGSPPWVEQAARALGLGFTLRPKGRPRKRPE